MTKKGIYWTLWTIILILVCGSPAFYELMVNKTPEANATPERPYTLYEDKLNDGNTTCVVVVGVYPEGGIGISCNWRD